MVMTLRTVQELLGHKHVNTTNDLYSCVKSQCEEGQVRSKYEFTDSINREEKREGLNMIKGRLLKQWITIELMKIY